MKIYNTAENQSHITISRYPEVDELSLAKVIIFTSWNTKEKGEKG